MGHGIRLNTSSPSALDNARAALAAGQIASAEKALERIAPADRHLDWQLLRFMLLRHRGDVTTAEALLHTQLRQYPDSVALRLNLGNLQRERGQLSAALATLATATQLAPQSAMAWHSLGLAQLEAGRWDAAAESLYAAAKVAPQFTEARLAAALALARGGHADAARAACDSTEGQRATAQEEMLCAQVRTTLRDAPAALASCKAVLRLEPHNAAAQLQQALVLEQSNRPEDARSCLQQLPEPARHHPLATLIEARLLIRERRWQDALNTLPARAIGDPDLAIDIAFERARLLDRLQQYDAAFTVATQANSAARQRRAGADDIFTQLVAEQVDIPAPAAPGEEASGPIFLIGPPRSGSTLLDVCLDVHPQLHVLSEEPLLEALLPRLQTLTNRPYPENLGNLQPDHARILREDYQRLADERRPGRGADARIVDKNPLNALRLPLIRALFPHAPIIRTRRDLRDAAVSCFFNDLGGRGTQGFWSLDESLTLLCTLEQVMDTQLALGTAAPNDVAYEDLAREPSRVLAKLFAALEVDDHPSATDHAAAAAARGMLGTPS
ncbi:MAG: sulfotransferase, partial [Oceanococcaceae bacterium]